MLFIDTLNRDVSFLRDASKCELNGLSRTVLIRFDQIPGGYRKASIVVFVTITFFDVLAIRLSPS